MRLKPSTVAAVTALATSSHSALAQHCTPEWDNRFNYAALNGEVYASVVFDDGTGPALYVAGSFSSYLGTPVRSVARWDGQRFQPVGNQLSGPVYALTVWDRDGPGPTLPALYAGGSIWYTAVNGAIARRVVVRWNGQTWSPLLDGFNQFASVRALCVHNDGTGAKLILGGNFTANGLPLNNLAAYDGNSWSSVNQGVSDTDNSAAVYALASVNEPAGPALYVGGDFSHAGGVPARAIARLRNGQWTALGDDFGYYSGLNPTVRTITAANMPSTGGPCIVAGGTFTSVGGLPIGGIAKWSGTSWEPLQYTTNWGGFRMVGVADLGSGPALYASSYHGFERWNGATWDLIADGVFGANTMAVDNQGPHPKLYIAGNFLRANDAAAPGVAVYDGSTLSGIGATGAGLSAPARAFATGDLGQGRRLYAVGDFTHGNGISLNHSAMWTGASWAALGTGLPDLNDSGYASDFRGLTIHDDGSGPHLYAAELEQGLFRLNDGQWQQLGQLDGATMGVVNFDPDAAGPLPSSIYAIGTLNVGGSATPIARWTGTAWESVFVTGFPGVPTATAARVFDPDGLGPQPAALYLAGQFNINGEYCVLAKWNGQTWTPHASEYVTSPELAFALTVHNDGTGPTLYAVGSFAASTIMRLVGDEWEPYGDALRPYATPYSTSHPTVRGLVSVDLGAGPELVMVGFSFYVDGNYHAAVVHRDGTWVPYEYEVTELGTIPYTTAATVFDDGSNPALFISGSFTGANYPGNLGGPQSHKIARLSLCTPGCTSDFNNDGDAGTDADIESFFACLAANCCPRCAPADFNNDGDSGTDADIESFFRVLAGGAC